MIASIRSRLSTRTAAAACALVAGLAAGPATAADRLLLSGAEFADAAFYSYVGTVLPLGANKDGAGWIQRYWVDRFGYEYDGLPGRVKARVTGFEAAIGYGDSNERGWWNFTVAARHTNTNLTPDDVAALARNSQTGAKLQLEGESRVGDGWRVGGAASYVTAQRNYWVRTRVERLFGPTRSLGVEGILNGNEEAQSHSVGLVSVLRPAGSRWSVAAKAGYRFQTGFDGAYGGLELGYTF